METIIRRSVAGYDIINAKTGVILATFSDCSCNGSPVSDAAGPDPDAARAAWLRRLTDSRMPPTPDDVARSMSRAAVAGGQAPSWSPAMMQPGVGSANEQAQQHYRTIAAERERHAAEEQNRAARNIAEQILRERDALAARGNEAAAARERSLESARIANQAAQRTVVPDEAMPDVDAARAVYVRSLTRGAQ
ncbi:hypothetical protein [Paraburkholderia silvatlantica]|uniref:Uncharacterized protein n=1 Tax=Paraburkholderia silvatlantica TaxID=321895 RepID=A0ABR6FRT0_9BURK|nr:hypothetical protein [Paraburkholderia silvatlantica]MBB2930144.1 hypothetical protein [Paraburkholderia silvatlantica]PVY22485.1 hypothetical protein C7411_13185 [Paraburkholderia silvatlantica]PXW28954.1 hypothetical protein C7413_13185 [Paraburkholderia silvatlantica]